MRTASWILLSLVALSGCALSVNRVSPRPNLYVDSGGQTLALSIRTTIPDDYLVPSQGGVRPVQVKGWRQSLTAGFRNGFATSFELADSSAESDLTIELLEAELGVVPTAWSEEGAPVMATVEIRYKAHLSNANGTVLARSARTVMAKAPTTEPREVTRLAGSAVEAMYEAIAFDLFP